MQRFLASLQTAWARKKHLLDETNALRLLNAGASGAPGLVVELYGTHLVAYDYDGHWAETFRKGASDWLRAFGWESFTVKDRSRPGDGDRGQGFAAAGNPPARLEVREGPLRFWVEPEHPRNVGLFLDTRELRKRLLRECQAGNVLNLFSYTCSLGIAALAGGAVEVVNVDISGRYLAWGRENLGLNSTPGGKCLFKKMDGEGYVDWAAKQGRRFRHIFLDPPVFARFDGGVFRFERDYFRLAEKCAARLEPGGTLTAATNFSGLGADEFSARLKQAMALAGRRCAACAPIPLPPDFDLTLDAGDRPEGNALIFQLRAE